MASLTLERVEDRDRAPDPGGLDTDLGLTPGDRLAGVAPAVGLVDTQGHDRGRPGLRGPGAPGLDP